VVKEAKVRSVLSRVIRYLVIGLAVAYAAVCVLVFLDQRHLLYFPTIRTAAQVDQLAKAANMERWTNAAGESIGMRRLATNGPAIGTVFMMYGNGSTAVRCSVYADAIQPSAPLDFYVLEYPGYEDRPGAPTQASLLNAAKEAFQRLNAHKPIFLIGESLGTGVASYIAGQYPDKITGLMLLSPYNRLADVAQSHYPFLPARWILQDDFRSADYLRTYHGLLGVMIDGQDAVVPARLGRQLFDGYAGPKRAWEYPNCNHVQLGESPTTFWKAVTDYWLSAGIK